MLKRCDFIRRFKNKMNSWRGLYIVAVVNSKLFVNLFRHQKFQRPSNRRGESFSQMQS